MSCVAIDTNRTMRFKFEMRRSLGFGLTIQAGMLNKLDTDIVDLFRILESYMISVLKLSILMVLEFIR